MHRQSPPSIATVLQQQEFWRWGFSYSILLYAAKSRWVGQRFAMLKILNIGSRFRPLLDTRLDH